MVLFIQGSNFRESGHILIAVGICYAQDVGAHRHKRYEGKVTAENELWKRAFWVLVCCDTIISATLGRPRMTTTDECVRGVLWLFCLGVLMCLQL